MKLLTLVGEMEEDFAVAYTDGQKLGMGFNHNQERFGRRRSTSLAATCASI